jgi:16S rRNA (guanine527-N7)-methyltransferase
MIEALERVSGRSVSRETLAKLETFVNRIKAANTEQNLVSATTFDRIWQRHIQDCAQLVRFEPTPAASWLDIGSGAGLPGLVIALLVEGPVTLVEPRRLRAAFLEDTVAALGLAGRVTVRCEKIEKIAGQFDVITARAVAPLTRLLEMAHHLAHDDTIWALPKGRSANMELVEARRSWQCEARSEASCTDPDARILVLSKVKLLGKVRAKSKR